MLETEQMKFWQSKFGAEYTERNTYNTKELDAFYKKTYGITRTHMTKEFLGNIYSKKILEVGCNVGNQLRHLQSFGHSELYGIEIQSVAVEKSKELCKEINIIQGSAFDIPFKDNYFDLVCTFGVLIHISPENINTVLDEIYRTSRKYIWGFEYYSDRYEEIEYRGNENKMWKSNFMELYLNRFKDLHVVKEQKYNYVEHPQNRDQMFLLEKST